MLNKTLLSDVPGSQERLNCIIYAVSASASLSLPCSYQKYMTGKVLENNTTGSLILILPLALAMVLLYKAWPVLLLIFGLSIVWKLWDKFQWQQWCQQVNPYFTELIRDNRGYLTPMDLSLKANLSGKAAKRFLDRKAQEYGAQRKSYSDKGIAYYFITASSLGSIFDDSEPVAAEELEALPPPVPHPFAPTESEKKENPSAFAALFQLKESRQQEEAAPSPESPNTTSDQPQSSLIQADLAKRLDITSSTLARRRTDPDFAAWSRSKDPDGIAWIYSPEAKVFVPLES